MCSSRGSAPLDQKKGRTPWSMLGPRAAAGRASPSLQGIPDLLCSATPLASMHGDSLAMRTTTPERGQPSVSRKRPAVKPTAKKRLDFAATQPARSKCYGDQVSSSQQAPAATSDSCGKRIAVCARRLVVVLAAVACGVCVVAALPCAFVAFVQPGREVQPGKISLLWLCGRLV